jgi:hypothetical protein
MKSKILAFLLPAACGAALAITLSVAAAEQPLATSETPATSPQQYSEYRNDQWHFSVFVPSNITAEATDQPGGQTIQFIDASGNELFQVSAWPYQDLVVHADGMHPQAPSQDADQPDELDTVHVYEGDLLTLTFIKNGVLYNVQATAQDATSTLDILKSWQFI